MRIPKISEAGQIRLGILLSYGQMALSIILSLLYTPYMLSKLGDAEYGLLQTALSTAAMLSVLSLGFNAGYIRYYAVYKKNNDTENIYRLNGLFLLIFTVLGAIVLLCGLVLSFHLEWMFDEGLTAGEYATARILTILATLNLAVSFPSSVFSNIISAQERFIYLKLISLFSTVMTPVMNILMLTIGFRSVAIVSVYLGVSLLSLMFYAGYTWLVLKQKFWFRDFERGLFRSLTHFTGLIFINMLVDQINNQVDKLLLARFCGSAAVALYAVGATFQTYFTSFSSSISGIFTPRVHTLVQSTAHDQALQRESLTALFTKVGRIQFMLLALIASGFVFFGQAFLTLWVGPGYEASYWVAVICMVPSIVPLTQNVGIEIQRAENRHHYRSYLYGFIAIFNLASSIYLCQIWGPVGAAIGTGAACIIGNSLLMDIVYHKKINIDMIVFWKSILQQLRGMAGPFLMGWCIMQFVTMDSWAHMIIWACGYTMVYCGFVWKFSMNGEEQGLVRQMIKKFLRR